MSMVEKEKDLVGFAHKVISFRMNVIKACKARGIDAPTDEQISAYINVYGLHFEDFMADYTEHEGMFRCLRTPFEEFKEGLAKINFGVAPTNDEIKKFFELYGNDVSLFCRQRTINQMKPLVRKTYLKTIDKLSYKLLIKLWNTFIEESSLYGADSHIYDLTDLDEGDYIQKNMEYDKLEKIYTMAVKNNTNYIQVIDGEIIAKSNDDILSTIIAYWEEIFERIMLYPSCYDFNVQVYCEGDGSTYFDDVFFPIIAKEVGYIVDGNKGIIKEIEKNS